MRCFPGLFGIRPRQPVDTAKLVESARAMLRNAYSAYIDIKQCREAQVGLGMYVSDQEMERARKAVRDIEQTVKRHLDPATFDDLWSRVEAAKRDRVVDKIVESPRITCVWRRGQVPDNGPIVKDF
jgi:hypothetical protein